MISEIIESLKKYVNEGYEICYVILKFKKELDIYKFIDLRKKVKQLLGIEFPEMTESFIMLSGKLATPENVKKVYELLKKEGIKIKRAKIGYVIHKVKRRSKHT